MYNRWVIQDPTEWLSLAQAAKRFGYSHPDSLRNRLRELRERGRVVDLGVPPATYKVGVGDSGDKVVLYWINPRNALMRQDAPAELLVPKRGKRARRGD